MRVLVLGGTSYVAQFLLQRLLHEAHGLAMDLACTIRAPCGSELPSGFVHADAQCSDTRVIRVFHGVSLLDMDSVRRSIEAFDPHVIVNCIAMSSPAACEKNPDLATALNEPVDLVSYLDSYAETQGRTLRYIHFSTDFVYDGIHPPSTGYREQDAVLSPRQCVYSATKLRFDNLLMQNRPPNLSVVVLRIANVVGPRAPFFVDHGTKFAEWLYNEVFLSPEKLSVPVRLWSDEVRCFVYVHDLAWVIDKLFSSPCEAAVELFNVGGMEALSRVAFAERFLETFDATRTHREIEPTQRALVDLGYQPPLDARLDSSKILKALQDFQFSTTDDILLHLHREFEKRSSN